MLLTIVTEGFGKLNIQDMEARKKVRVEGIVHCAYFNENYIKELEEKAKKYDELMEDGLLQKTLLDIALALNATNNTVTTDVPELCVEDDKHWKIDNSLELEALIKIGKIIKNK